MRVYTNASNAREIINNLKKDYKYISVAKYDRIAGYVIITATN